MTMPQGCKRLRDNAIDARVVKLVDTRHLKCLAGETGMPVRFRPRAPLQRLFDIDLAVYSDKRLAHHRRRRRVQPRTAPTHSSTGDESPVGYSRRTC